MKKVLPLAIAGVVAATLSFATIGAKAQTPLAGQPAAATAPPGGAPPPSAEGPPPGAPEGAHLPILMVTSIEVLRSPRGGGAPVNKLFENGSFASTRTAFCALTQMVPTDLLLEAFDRLEQNLANEAADGGTTPGLQTAGPIAAQLSRVS